MYRILVTNDDGINAEGIRALVKSLSEIATVYVVAPSEQQSAKSRSLTFLRPVSAEETEMEGAEVAYSLTGTPSDCIKWGIFKFASIVQFDYIVSGINMGDNTGAAVYYSGTVAGALEGAMNGFRSIALSVASHEAEHFEYICSIIPELLDMSAKLDKDVVLNVNVPNIPADRVKGVRIVELAEHKRRPEFHFHDNEEGNQQMSVVVPEFVPDLSEDYSALTAGYATITPMRSGLTSHVALRQLKSVSQDENLTVFLGVQNDAVDGLWRAKAFEENIRKWAEICGRMDMPTMIVEHYGNGKTLDAVIDAVRNDELVEILEFNAFENKNFMALAEASCCRRVYIAGMQTHIAVYQTAREFVHRGYEVVILADCCSAKSKEDHKITIDSLRAEGCRIATIEAAAMELLGSSVHPACTAVKKIIDNKNK